MWPWFENSCHAEIEYLLGLNWKLQLLIDVEIRKGIHVLTVLGSRLGTSIVTRYGSAHH